MSSKELTRKYKVSDAKFVQQCDIIVLSAKRDLVELAAYGVTDLALQTITDTCQLFKSTVTDDELMGDMMVATQRKKDMQEKLLIQIRQIADRARIHYGEGSAKFRSFGVDHLTGQTDGEQIRTGRRVVYAATTYFAELIEEGLTQVMIDNLATYTAAFDTLIDEQDNSVRRRDIAVEERITLGNYLFALVTKLAAKAKLCWVDTNEAKYNDYSLTEKKGSKAQTVDGAVPAQGVVNISATGIKASTRITFTNNGNVALSFYFAKNPMDAVGDIFISIPPGSTQEQPTSALGFNAELGLKRLNVFNGSKEQGKYVVEWG